MWSGAGAHLLGGALDLLGALGALTRARARGGGGRPWRERPASSDPRPAQAGGLSGGGAGGLPREAERHPARDHQHGAGGELDQVSG